MTIVTALYCMFSASLLVGSQMSDILYDHIHTIGSQRDVSRTRRGAPCTG